MPHCIPPKLPVFLLYHILCKADFTGLLFVVAMMASTIIKLKASLSLWQFCHPGLVWVMLGFYVDHHCSEPFSQSLIRVCRCSRDHPETIKFRFVRVTVVSVLVVPFLWLCSTSSHSVKVTARYLSLISVLSQRQGNCFWLKADLTCFNLTSI